MRVAILLAGLIYSVASAAIESTVTVPWKEFDDLYQAQISQRLKDTEKEKPDPVVVLDSAVYDLAISGPQVMGSVEITGNVLLGKPEPLPLFGKSVVVTEVLEAQNVALLAAQESYTLRPFKPGAFSIRFSVSIPILDLNVKPRLEVEVPSAVRNQLKLSTSSQLSLLPTSTLHPMEDAFFFSPRRLLEVGFEHVNLPLGGADTGENVLSEVDTPEAVLESVTFFSSFTEDGTVLSAMHLIIPPNDNHQLELDPIDGADVWSLEVNDKPRSLYLSANNKWVIPLDAKSDSKVVLAYLTRGKKLGLEGRLDLQLPETGLTARELNLIVGLPERMQMLAMDSDLQPASNNSLPEFSSFSGHPHYFSKPFYRGQSFNASIIYQEPVNP